MALVCLALGCSDGYNFPWSEVGEVDVAITSPTGPDFYTQGYEAVTVTAHADPQPELLEILVNGEVRVSFLAPPYDWSWLIDSELSYETFTLEARATLDGVVSKSELVDVHFDRLAPYIIENGVAPVPGDDNVYMGDVFDFQLSEPVHPDYVNASTALVYVSDGGPLEEVVDKHVELMGDGRTLRVRLTAPVPVESSLQIQISNLHLQDLAGNHMQEAPVYDWDLPRWVWVTKAPLNTDAADAPMIARGFSGEVLVGWLEGNRVQVGTLEQETGGPRWKTRAPLGTNVSSAQITMDMDEPMVTWQDASTLYVHQYFAGEWVELSASAPSFSAGAQVGTDGVPTLVTHDGNQVSIARWDDVLEGWKSLTTQTCDTTTRVTVDEMLALACVSGNQIETQLWDPMSETWNSPLTALAASPDSIQMGLDTYQRPVIGWQQGSTTGVWRWTGRSWQALPQAAADESSVAVSGGEIARALTIGGQVMVQVYDDIDGQWVSLGTVPSSNATQPQIAHDVNDRPVVLWEQNGYILLKRYNSL